MTSIFEHLRQHKPSLEVDDIRWVGEQYRELRGILLEVDKQDIGSDGPDCASPKSAIPFGPLTPLDGCGTPLEVHVCDPSPAPPFVCVDCPTLSFTHNFIGSSTFHIVGYLEMWMSTATEPSRTFK